MTEIVCMIAAILCTVITGSLAWFAFTHWPANGFVRVPRELARQRERQHQRDQFPLGTNRVVPNDGSTRVKSARLVGRRRISTAKSRRS